MRLGERIRAERIAAGMTQKNLGELCGMADSAIRKYESGIVTPKTATLIKITKALGAENPLDTAFEWWREGCTHEKEGPP